MICNQYSTFSPAHNQLELIISQKTPEIHPHLSLKWINHRWKRNDSSFTSGVEASWVVSLRHRFNTRLSWVDFPKTFSHSNIADVRANSNSRVIIIRVRSELFCASDYPVHNSANQDRRKPINWPIPWKCPLKRRGGTDWIIIRFSQYTLILPGCTQIPEILTTVYLQIQIVLKIWLLATALTTPLSPPKKVLSDCCPTTSSPWSAAARRKLNASGREWGPSTWCRTSFAKNLGRGTRVPLQAMTKPAQWPSAIMRTSLRIFRSLQDAVQIEVDLHPTDQGDCERGAWSPVVASCSLQRASCSHDFIACAMYSTSFLCYVPICVLVLINIIPYSIIIILLAMNIILCCLF